MTLTTYCFTQMLRISFRLGGYVDRRTLYIFSALRRTPTCMPLVHFEASLRNALVDSMPMLPGAAGRSVSSGHS